MNHPSNVVEYSEAQPLGPGIPVLLIQNEGKLAEAIALDFAQALACLGIGLAAVISLNWRHQLLDTGFILSSKRKGLLVCTRHAGP